MWLKHHLLLETNIMIKIAHRGNIAGKKEMCENHPEYIREAIAKDFHVEIDLWKIEDRFFLGHNEPQYEVDKNFIYQPRLFIHAKNRTSLQWLFGTDIHYFWLDKDPITLTSKGIPWGEMLIEGGIFVNMNKQLSAAELIKCYGVCDDQFDYLPAEISKTAMGIATYKGPPILAFNK